ncbi:transglutaminase family protein [Rhodobacter maris]|uniref:Transglutaminase-like putative cysteine protease n=1 Tax=Rhodobacter maris TaxID=446682 RepID=A0A285SLD9_9RHOB|nr:transglutaminase family protein [Rhodobacter maris]SOC08150.1 transglutaminase-like putative cysteine protease [Rhodobacter maris]
MRYDIHLSIDYTYAAPSDHLRNLVRLLPAELPGRQRVWSRKLTVTPTPDERRDTIDFFGNAMTSVVWHGPVAEAIFELSARVERLAVGDPLDLSPPLADLGAEVTGEMTLAPASPHHFLGASPRVVPCAEITAFARAAVPRGISAYGAVTALGHALHHHMSFDAEATTVDTPPREAFVQRRGVCQDFTHVMIAGLRGLGIPAGYVSGFLRTFPPPGAPRLEGADAMHAWVRAWVGREMGWIEFDPTNDQGAGLDYISVAVGRDYDDVAPVRGALRSAGSAETSQAVDVLPLDS